MGRPTTIRRNKHHQPGADTQTPAVKTNQQALYIDNYRAPQSPQIAGQFADVLENFTSAMHHADSGLFADLKEEKQRKGAIAGFLGIDIGGVPDEAPDIASRTRQKIRGGAAAIAFRKELNEYYQANKDQRPEIFNHGLMQLKQKHLKGKDRSFIEGLLDKGMKAEEDTLASYYGYQDKKDALQFLDETGANLLADFVTWSEDPHVDAETLATLTWEKLQQMKELNSMRGTDREEVEKRALQLIGPIAKEKGLPELLQFAEVENKDGVSLAKTKLAPLYQQYKDDADAKADSNRVNGAYARVIEAHRQAGTEKVDYNSAIRALADPEYQEELGVDFTEAERIKNVLKAERDDIRQTEIREKDDQKVDVLNDIYTEWNKGTKESHAKARQILKASDLNEALKYKISVGLDKSFDEDKSGYNAMVSRIVNGDVRLSSTILSQAGTLYSVKDAMSLVNFLEDIQKPEGKLIKIAMDAVKRGISKAGMLGKDTPATEIAIQAGLMEMQRRIQEAREKGEDVSELLRVGHSKYVVSSIIQTHRLSQEQEMSSLMAQLGVSKGGVYSTHESMRGAAKQVLEKLGRSSTEADIDTFLSRDSNVHRLRQQQLK